MSLISVIELFVLSTCLVSVVQFTTADDLPILHSGCNEFEDASEPTQLPYPNDCSKFYKCAGGYAFTMSCPRGLHWSVKLNRCEFPAVAQCKSSGGSEVLSTTSIPITTQTNDGGIIVLNCPAGENPEEPTHLPYPGDCTKFFKCRVGKAYPLNCPLGLHWSVALNRCEWPDIAKCSKVPNKTTSTPSSSQQPPGANSTLTPSTSVAPTTKTTASNPAQPPFQPSVSTFVPTSTPTSTTTQAPTTVTSTVTEPSTTTVTILPGTNLNIFCKNTSSTFVAYPGNCMRYIQCINGKARSHFCPGNLLFNSKIGVCSRTCG